MKAFAALQYRGQSSQLKVEFERPNVSKFIHELYKHSARKLWQTAYLFKVDVSSEQQDKNRNEIEQVIYKCIDDVVKSCKKQLYRRNMFDITGPCLLGRILSREY
jgi:hypothetical protein